MRAIIIHCSDTPNGRHHTAAEIHSWHLARGWAGIGYHYLIQADGTVERGRPEYWTGAHVGGHNTDTLGICLIGRDDYGPSQWDSLAWLVRDIKSRHPEATVCGHHDYDPGKTCPGFDARHWWAVEVERLRIEGLRP